MTHSNSTGQSPVLHPAVNDLIEVLVDIVTGDVGRATLGKLADGQGTDTADGRAWLKAQAVVKAKVPKKKRSA